MAQEALTVDKIAQCSRTSDTAVPETNNLEEAENPSGQDVEIDAEIASQITHATQQNDVSVIANLVVANRGNKALENLRLTLTVDPPLIDEKVWSIDRLSANDELRPADRTVSLASGMLSRLTERRNADLSLKLTSSDGKLLAEKRDEIIGLARNEWGGANHMPELLAAFVMPNDPVVDKVLRETSEVLRRSEKECSLEGYQKRSRKRVWEIAAALWSAVAQYRLTYAEPPASFESNGQKIRTPSEVIGNGLATCLDTTVFFAAALEKIGFRPLIALTHGHALCGLWLQPQGLQALTTDDCAEIRKYRDLDELVLFETTMITGHSPAKFSQAIEAGKRQLAEEVESKFVYALDIHRARHQQRILPLSTEIKAKEVETQETVVAETSETAPNLPAFDFGLETAEKPETPEDRLDHWKRKLLDLTKRNRLLNLKDSKTAIPLICPDLSALEDKLAKGEKISVKPLDKTSRGNSADGEQRDIEIYEQNRNESYVKAYAKDALERNEIVSVKEQNDLNSGLVQLYRKSRTDLQEGGANTLFLALGVLRWRQSPDEIRCYRAPLILVPVKLERRSAASKVKIVRHEDEVVFNMTLLEMLRKDFELSLPELDGDLPKDDAGVDVNRIWNIMRRAVLDIQGFEVVEDVVLSTFSFAKFLMWKDLSDRTDELKESPFVAHLIDNPRAPYASSSEFLRPEEIDEKIDPSELFMPLPADSSQIVAVHASAAGGSFVLQGPPGTGKSQTIANMIAHNLGQGRRVLFVSEKMAALEVVYRRLKEKGLGRLCLELHSSKANKKDVLSQLDEAWSERGKEAEWETETARLKSLRDGLNDFVRSLHSPGKTGISPRAAIGRVVRYKDIHRLKLSWQNSLCADRANDKEDLNRLKDIARDLGQVRMEISSEDENIFRELRKEQWSHTWQANFVRAAHQLITCIDQVLVATKQLTNLVKLPESQMHLEAFRGLETIAALLPAASRIDLRLALIDQGSSQALENLQRALQKLEAYREEKKTLSRGYSDEAIANAQVETWKSCWHATREKIWPFRTFSRYALAVRMKKAADLTHRPDPAGDIQRLENLQVLRSEMERAARDLPNEAHWKKLETDVERTREGLTANIQLHDGVARLSADIDQLVSIRKILRNLVSDGQGLLTTDMPIAKAGRALTQSIEAFDVALSDYIKESEGEIRDNLDLTQLKAEAERVLAQQVRINTWCRWQEVRNKALSVGLDDLVAGLENGLVPAGEAEETFKTAYCKWIAPLLIDEREELRTFSVPKQETKITDFRNLDERLSKLSVDYIKARLSGEIPARNDQNRPEAYGGLQREIQKKSRHLPVRQLMDKLGDELAKLTPCLLMSPLSVAQFLAAGSRHFDLVIFDEASQITVWDAIGAIARGKDVIVVGDPKQMPPTSFFDRAASEDAEEETGFADDMESILDEAQAAEIKTHRLTGHYRSHHESLIAFSNHRYYHGDLVTYPSNETKASAVTFHKVDGLYQRGKGRTNPVEAKAMVAEMVRHLKDPELSRLSIGAVTLNSEQQRLVENLLDGERRKDSYLEKFFGDDVDEPVFVKNLETVQGDQRDIILLSVGYGPDTPDAKAMSMNFGPLNKKGGERRLNVAITRATTKKVIFASFDPSMIDLTRTSAEGVRDLKHYLEFADRGPVALGEALKSIGGLDSFESDFEEAVAIGMVARGWSLHTQIGVSKFRIDLGVIHPDQPGYYLAGIECDGATYHSSPSARDRDRVRQTVLESLGWSLLRIWSTDFFIDPNGTLDRIDQKLSEMLEESRAGATSDQTTTQTNSEQSPTLVEAKDEGDRETNAEFEK